MCIVCKQMMPKNTLLRIVKNKDDEIFIDYTNKANGRGAYVCDNQQCVMTCLKKKMPNKIFNCQIPEEIYIEISKNYETQN